MLFTWYGSGTHPASTVSLGFLAYNAIAFGFQPLIGYLSDTYRKIPIEVIGCPLLIAGLLLMPAPAASIILLGLGNAAFHIAGGIDCLRHSNGKLARSGVFVSSGALGVALGSLAGKSGNLPVHIPVSVMLLCLILLSVIYIRRKDSEHIRTAFAITKPKLDFGKVILFASASIAIRSYIGATIPVEWKTTTVLVLFPAIGAFIGKACGGFISDRIGVRKTAALSLLASAVLLAFGYKDPYVYLIGIVLFNMSMSVTLCAIASVLPLNPGLAFGITTLALLCGNAPTFFISVTPAPPVFAALTIISAACLYYILERPVNKNEEINAQNQQHDV